jgi:hypothetical protein
LLINPLLRFLSFLFIVSRLGGDSLSIIMVGDIMMGSTYPTANLPPDQGSGLFAEVTPIIKQADLALGNLEGTLLDGGVCTKKAEPGRAYAFRTPPAFAQNLSQAGFDCMNLANNHMNDFGPGGIESTIKALAEQGMEYGGPDGHIARFQIRALKVSIVCFATSPRTNSIVAIKEAQHLVAEEKRTSDIVIVSFHGGGEGLLYLHTRDTTEFFLGSCRGNVVRFSRSVVDSGADLVWGHGPHVPRSIEVYKDRLIAYSLGNFLTWGFNIDGVLGYTPILEVTVDANGAFRHGRVFSCQQHKGEILKIDPQAQALELMKKLSAEDFPVSSPSITDEGIVLPRTAGYD